MTDDWGGLSADVASATLGGGPTCKVERLLAQPHVGVLGVVVEYGAPLTIPIWDGCRPGGPVSVITGQDSRKARVIQAGGWLCLCAQGAAWGRPG